MNSQLLVTLNVDDLKSIINESISNAFLKVPQPKEDEVLLKRKDVAKLFSVSLVTITEWMKTGKLPFNRINSRVYFKRSEVIEALNNKVKYKRI